MKNKTCVTCGGELKFNRNLGFFECTFCGKIHAMTGKDTPLSLKLVDQHMHAHRFNQAKEALAELMRLEPDNPLFVLRKILCKFGMTSAPLLLSCAKSNPAQIRKILDCPDWDDLGACITNGRRNIVDAIKEYCTVSLELINVSERIDQNRYFLDDQTVAAGSFWKIGSDQKKNRSTEDRSVEKKADGKNAGGKAAAPEAEGKFTSLIRSKLPKPYYLQIKEKEEEAAAVMQADLKTKAELQAKQQALLQTVKELEAEL